MTEFSKARRRLMLGSAAFVGSGMAALAAGRPAHAAMQGYQLNPASPLGIAVKNRCGPSSGHAAIAAQLRQRLMADPALTTLVERCPICGCPIIVSR